MYKMSGQVIYFIEKTVKTWRMELTAERKNLRNQEKIRTLGEKEASKYMRILVADDIKQEERKEKNKKVYLRRTRRLL